MADKNQDQSVLEEVARRHDVSLDAVTTLVAALRRGGGTQAQFSHPDLGGMGQWSRGGMTMVGDMFNRTLKTRVDQLCAELSGLITEGKLQDAAPNAEKEPAGTSDRWPEDLGRPGATGSQNDMRYAVFPDTHRLAIEQDGRTTVYDTGDHRIGGVSQQQSDDRTITFTSQHGTVRPIDLPKIKGPDAGCDQRSQDSGKVESSAQQQDETPSASSSTKDDVLAKIEQLADLHRKTILSDDEFNTKKTELLARL